MQRFGVTGKLAPRYIGSYEIIEKCGPVAYRVKLPTKLLAIHDVFHVSQLKKCVRVPTEIVLMMNVQSKSLTKRKERQEDEKLGCTRSNGVIIPRNKPRGKPKTTSIRIFLVFFPTPKVPHFHTTYNFRISGRDSF